MSSSRLHVYRDENSTPEGSPVVLLHGLGSCGEDWPLQVLALRSHRNVYAVDLPGHGQSPPFGGWPRMEDYGHALAAWMRDRRMPPAHIVGLSLGGLVALQVAVDNPQQVKSVTIVNAFGRMRVGIRGGLHSIGRLLLLLFGKMDWLGAWVAAALFPEDGQEELRKMAAVRIAGNPRNSYLQAVIAIVRFDVDERLAGLDMPVMVVAGGRDLIVPLQAKQKLATRIPAARFELIPESGHVTPIDAGDRFNQLLKDFLEQKSTGALLSR